MTIAGVKDAPSAYAAAANYESSRIPGANKLSETAKSYLNEVQQKFPDANITVVDINNREQYLNYALGSSGLNNVAIPANIVEKMATDANAAAKYEGAIADLPELAKNFKKLEEENPNLEVVSGGVIIDKNGKVSYWGVSINKNAGERQGTNFSKEMQKRLTEQRAAKKAEEKSAAKKEKNAAIAETILELNEKLKSNMELSPDLSVQNTERLDKSGKLDLFI